MGKQDDWTFEDADNAQKAANEEATKIVKNMELTEKFDRAGIGAKLFLITAILHGFGSFLALASQQREAAVGAFFLMGLFYYMFESSVPQDIAYSIYLKKKEEALKKRRR